DLLHLNNFIAAHAVARCARHALLAQPQLLPGLRPRRNLQLRPSAAIVCIDGRHFDLCAQRGFRNGHRHRDMDIVAHAGEYRMRPDLDDQIQVARRAALRSRVAFARKPDTLPIARAGLNAELQRLALGDGAFAAAHRAGILHLAGPAAARALDVELHPSAHLRHLARAVALGALHAAPGDRPAMTGRARLLPLNLQPRHSATHRCPEVHVHLILEVGSRLRPARLLFARKDAAEDVAEAAPEAAAGLRSTTARSCPTAALEAGKIEAAEIERHLTGRRLSARAIGCAKSSRSISATRRGLGRRRIDIVRVEAKLVINLALLLVAEDVVGLRDLLELLLRLLVARVHVRVILARQLAEGLADLL